MPKDAMRDWAGIAERVAATSKTSEKRRILAAYLRDLAPDDLSTAARFFTGRPFPESDQRPPGLGWAAIATAVEEVTGADRAALAAAYDRTSDLGDAVAIVVARSGGHPMPAAAPDTTPAAATPASRPRGGRRSVRRHPRRVGSRAEVGALRRAPRACDAATARFVVKLLTGDLRIGLREGLLEAAIADAFDRPPAAVARAPDAHRRRRRDRPPRPDGPPRRARRSRRSVPLGSCSPRRPRTRRRSWPGSAPWSGSRTSTTGSAPSSTGAATRSASSAGTSTT